MSQETGNDIKEVERYFFSLVGKGVMLSSKDYFILKQYLNSNMSKEMIIKGISKAYQENPQIKNISDCKDHIDKVVDYYTKKSYVTESNLTDNKIFIQQIISDFNKTITRETNNKLKNHYVLFRDEIIKLLDEETDSVFSKLDLLENEYYEIFFQSLDDDEANELINQALSVMPKANYLNEDVRDKTIKIYRNKLITDKYGLINLFAANLNGKEKE